MMICVESYSLELKTLFKQTGLAFAYALTVFHRILDFKSRGGFLSTPFFCHLSENAFLISRKSRGFGSKGSKGGKVCLSSQPIPASAIAFGTRRSVTVN